MTKPRIGIAPIVGAVRVSITWTPIWDLYFRTVQSSSTTRRIAARQLNVCWAKVSARTSDGQLMRTDAIVFLPLSQGKVVIIDFDDMEKVGRVKWSAANYRGRWYAERGRGNNRKRLHREVLDAPAGSRGDHKNGNGLDNRRENLRVRDQRGNARAFQRKRSGTSSQYRGVSWFRGKWAARIGLPGSKKLFLGYHSSEETAARIYDAEALARGFEREALNFP